jgi:hypothetical protein
MPAGPIGVSGNVDTKMRKEPREQTWNTEESLTNSRQRLGIASECPDTEQEKNN